MRHQARRWMRILMNLKILITVIHFYETIFDFVETPTISVTVGLPTRGNNTSNYVERGFGILKDIFLRGRKHIII